MIKLKAIQVKRFYDDDADTSFLGKYTDIPDPWAICCNCGEYLNAVNVWDRIIDRLENDAYYLREHVDELLESATLSTEKSEQEIIVRLEKVLHAEIKAIETIRETKQHSCPRRHRRYNYFKPYAGGEKEGSKEYQRYGWQDFERAEGLNDGKWFFIGIKAEAEVESNGRIHKFTSGGLWGIESDAEEHHKDVAKEELEDLKKQLQDFNVDLSNWDELTKNIVFDGFIEKLTTDRIFI